LVIAQFSHWVIEKSVGARVFKITQLPNYKITQSPWLTLVSHPDEVKVVSRRFGQGAG